MSTPHSGAGGNPAYPDQNPNQRQGPYRQIRLTDPELALLRQCSWESMIYRVLPFAVGGLVGLDFLIRRGHVYPASRGWKNASVMLFSYIGGKILYFDKCQQKFKSQFPDSVIVGGKGYSPDLTQPNTSLAYSTGTTRFEDSSLQNVSELDESRRPTLDREVKLEEETPTAKKGDTYESLRRKNREAYGYPPASAPDMREPQARGPFVRREPTPSVPQGKRNKYGDLLDE